METLEGNLDLVGVGLMLFLELTPEEAAWLTDLDGNQFSKPTNVDQLKKYYV